MSTNTFLYYMLKLTEHEKAEPRLTNDLFILRFVFRLASVHVARMLRSISAHMQIARDLSNWFPNGHSQQWFSTYTVVITGIFLQFGQPEYDI